MARDSLTISEEQRTAGALAHQETLHAFEIAKQHSASEAAAAEDTIRNLQESLGSTNEYHDLQYHRF